MSYTNSTPNYGLPQYVADDKPTYLGDFNKAMLDIDTNIKTVSNSATSAESISNTANTKSTEALETATEASTLANSASSQVTNLSTVVDNLKVQVSNADTNASTALTNAREALSTANQAETTANLAKSASDLNQSKIDDILTWTNPVSINSNLITNGDLFCSYNSTLKLITLFGSFSANCTAGENIIAKLPNAVLFPTVERVVYNICNTSEGANVNLRFKPNGDIVYVANTSIALEGRCNSTINFNFWN